MKTFFPFLLASICLVSPALSQDPIPGAEAEAVESIQTQILESFPGHFAKATEVMAQPYSATFGIGGEAPEGDFSGSIEVDFFHARMWSAEITFEAGDAESGEDMALSASVMADDTFLHLMADVPEMGGVQAFRIELDLLEELQADGLDSAGLEMSGLDQELDGVLDFLAMIEWEEVLSEDGTRIILRPDIGAILAMDPEAPESMDISIEFDVKTGFLMGMSASLAEEGSFFMKTEKLSFPEEIDESRFEFVLPEGVVEMDMTGMLRMSLPQGGADSFEEEF